MADIDRLRHENFMKFIEDGPRLRYDYNTWVEARCSGGHVLVGGLGGLGVGEMWFPQEDRHAQKPGYEDSQVVPRCSLCIEEENNDQPD